jgi:hypothetical protein
MKKISIGSWAYIIGPYVDDPLGAGPREGKAITIINANEPERR